MSPSFDEWERGNELQHSESQSPQRIPGGRIPGLDGLRAVSILLVLIGHGATSISQDGRWMRLVPYVGNATLGVTTFFVISGYLITFLLRKEWEKTATIDIRAFYTRRVLRIFPAFYTFLFVVTLLRATGYITTTYSDIGVSGLFLTNYKHLFGLPTNDDYWFVGHFWTLSLEEQFYLFWPVTFLVFGIVRAPRIALSIVLLAPVIRVISYFAWPSARGQLAMMLHTAADPIMIGCLAALLQGRPRFERVMTRLSAWYWPLMAALFLFIGSAWLAERFRGMYSITVGMSLNGLCIAFIMLWIVTRPASLSCRLLSIPVVRHIGILSYSLYLWQQCFLTTKNSSWSGTFPLNFVACFIAAELSYWLIESPFLRLRGRFSARKRVAEPGHDDATVTSSTGSGLPASAK